MQTINVPEKTDLERLNDYLIERNPEGVKKVLLLNGFNRFRTIRDMQLSLLELINSNPDSISQLLAEHPDYELIVSDYLDNNPASEPKVKKAKAKKSKAQIPTISLDMNVMVQLLMFLVCVWLALKIFNKD
jgi:hypothetical protein